MTDVIKSYKIRGVTFVSGLLWEAPIENVLLRETRKKLENQNIYFASRKIGKHVTQLGLVSNEEKNTAALGACSLAGTLCSIINEPTWIGAFTINSREMALVVVKNGVVLAGTDCVGSVEQISEKFVQIINMFHETHEEINRIYCPSDWNVPESRELILTSVISEKNFHKHKVLLHSFSGFDFFKKNRKKILTSLLFCGAMSCCFFCYCMYQHYQEEKENQKIVNTIYVTPPHEWEDKLLVDEQLLFWQAQLDKYPMTYEGWDLKSVSLSEKKTTLKYYRNEMQTADSFEEKAFAYFHVYPVFDNSGDTATITISLHDIKKVNNKESLLPGENANIVFFSYFQRIGISHMELKHVDVSLPPEPISNDDVTIYKWGKVTWQKFLWSFETSAPPYVIIYGLKKLPGLRISKISTSNINESNWKVEGVFYANAK
ncbi:TPA: type 4b pilus protein PilO2 [Salmonella enterica subsp. enterica serovar Hvittingfoss]|nr:type 4b pilus protein PilO2 [Salmonella enterica]HAR9317393.1 type 4b pilus protein PilO2 [Salmonella enterica]